MPIVASAVARAVTLVMLSGGLLAGLPAVASNPPSSQVAWRAAAAPVDIDRAFAEARAARKPVLLYWGATWCPPCNQLKATLFNRQDFAQLSRSFVAVHVDGDRPGAQKLGQQFKVSGYPTLVLLRADGSELTRLPGEAEASQVMELLRLGLAGGRPIKAVLADARGDKALSADEWRLLAFYSWETDDDQLLSGTNAASVLAQLAPSAARRGAAAETSTRLWLKAVAASDDGKGLKADDELRERVRSVLANPVQWRPQADVLVNSAPEMVRALGDNAERRRGWVAAFDPTLRALQADAGLSRADRLSALISRIELARIEAPRRELQPELPPALLDEVRQFARDADRGVTDAYERQAVIPSVAYAFERAGLWSEGESLLLANLARSHSAYYLMSQLGSMARKQGRNDEALRWYGKAFDASQGPATRLQWGASYLQALVDLAPADAARIESAAAQLFDEAAKDSGAFFKRSGRSMQRVARALQSWNKDGGHAASIRRLQARLKPVCDKAEAADGRRAECRGLLDVAAGKTSRPAG